MGRRERKDLPLTPIEAKVKDLYAQGYEVRTISHKLFKAPGTISTYLTRIKIKLGMPYSSNEELRVMLISKAKAEDLVYAGICGELGV